MINKSDFSKFGIGTWGIGGFAERNPDNDDQKQVKAMQYMLDKDINFVELNQWTAEGHAVKLFLQALQKSTKNRDSIFLSQVIYSHSAENLDAALAELDLTLAQFEIDFVDCLSFNYAGIINTFGVDTTFSFLHSQLKSKKTRYIGITNAPLSFLKIMKREFGDKLFLHEIGFNFEIRENEDLGILDFAKSNEVLNVTYQPFRRNRTSQHNYPLLSDLAKKYGKTQNQIILNWLTTKGLLPITKSETIAHINEHLSAFDFTIESEDLERMNNWRHPSWNTPEIDWTQSGKGVRIDQLSNVFDDVVAGIHDQ